MNLASIWNKSTKHKNSNIMFEIKKIEINTLQLSNDSKKKLSKETVQKDNIEKKKELPKSGFCLNLKSSWSYQN